MDKAGAFFFSRVKEGSALEIVSISQGLPQSCLGMKLSELAGKRYYRQDIDVIVQAKKGKDVLQFRVVGFYNKKEGVYHFYLTNLKAPVNKLSKLYNLRWQIELFFRGSQQSIGLGKYPSADMGIILNLLFASLIAQTLAISLFQEACEIIEKEEISAQEKAEKGCSISIKACLYSF